MILCDLCGQPKECVLKEIEGKEYDICLDCWNPIAGKLKGKGRTPKEHETVLLPSPVPERKEDEPKTPPAHPPKIWGAMDGSESKIVRKN